MKSRMLGLAGVLSLAAVFTFSLACSDDSADDDGDVTTPGGLASPVATMTVPPENGEANGREEFVTTIEARLDQLQTQIDELEDEVETMSGDTQSDAQVRVQDLKDRKNEIEAGLDAVDSATDDDYESIKSEIEAEVDSAMTEAQELADEIGI